MRVFNRDYQQPKNHFLGTRRSRMPSETLAAFGRFMPEIGITRLANVTGLDCIGIPVVQAVRPNSRSLSVSQGKGVNLDSAQVSAMMEAMELWHAERIEAPLQSASYDELKRTSTVIDIFKLPLREGARVRSHMQQAWIQGWDLIQGEPVWVPFESVNLNTSGVIPENQTFSCSSNGLASGNHLLEAIEHALCEIIERDTHAIYWAKDIKAQLKTRIDLTTVSDPSISDLLQKCAAAEIEVAAFEMESDVGIPTCCVGLLDKVDRIQWRRLGTQWGCGTHLAPEIALSRALTEAAQSRLTWIAGSRDDNLPQSYTGLQNLQQVTRSRQTAFAAPSTRGLERRRSLAETDSFEGDLQTMLGAIQAVGVDRVIVVDLSKERFGIPVVKLLATGLEAPPFQPGYVPGERALRARRESL